jgi:hypothetical protein
MATLTFTQSKSVTEKITTDRLVWAGVLMTVLAVATNLVIYFTAETLTDLTGFPLLNPVSIIASIGLASVLAAILYGVLGRYTTRPTDAFRTISIVGLLLSFVPILGLLLGVVPGVIITAGTVVTLVIMHTVAAATVFSMLTTIARQTGWEHTESLS